jgi:hypothetical protein
MDKKNQPPMKADHTEAKSGNNVFFLCGLCMFSLVFSSYTTYRGVLLESRVVDLEGRFVSLQRSVLEPSDILVTRLRKEFEDRLQRRVAREAVSRGRSLLMDDLEKDEGLGKLIRVTRDVGDCNCPAGELKKRKSIVTHVSSSPSAVTTLLSTPSINPYRCRGVDMDAVTDRISSAP